MGGATCGTGVAMSCGMSEPTTTASKTPRWKPRVTRIQVDADSPDNDVVITLRHCARGYYVTAVQRGKRDDERHQPTDNLDAASAVYRAAVDHYARKAFDAGYPFEYPRELTGRTVPCTGEAHSNPYIDNCMTCAPRWGVVDEVAPFDIDRARAGRYDVPCGMVSRATHWLFDAMEKDGDVRCVGVTRGPRSYFVWRWTAAAK